MFLTITLQIGKELIALPGISVIHFFIKYAMRYSSFLLGIIWIFTGISSFGQDQASWSEFMTPGPFHELLQNSDGEWNATITLWNLGEKGATAHATCTNSMILGGRYQQSHYKGNMLGLPFEGIGITAYDNARKVFLSTWIDNMGTSMMYSEGIYDSAKKEFVYLGYTTDPQSGELTDYRETHHIAQPDRQVMEMFMKIKGREYKIMEIVLERK